MFIFPIDNEQTFVYINYRTNVRIGGINMLRLRSRLLVSFIAAMVLIGITFTFNTIIGLNDVNSDTQVTYEKVIVSAGDTLWDIASSYVGDNGDIRHAIYEICNVNDISADEVYAGEELLIPDNL